MVRQSRLIVRLGWAAVALALLTLLFGLLYLVADAEGLGPGFERWYPYVFVAGAAALLLLAGAIVQRLWRLRRQLRQGVPGARLSRRLLALMLVLALPPVVLVYGFGVRFIASTVDSWLSANSDAALEQALAIGRLYLDERSASAEREVDLLAITLSTTLDDDLPAALEDMLDRSKASQLAVFRTDGRGIALAAADPAALTPAPPGPDALLAVNRGGRHAVAEPDGDGLRLRVLTLIRGDFGQDRLLQALYPLPADYAQRVLAIEAGVADVRRAGFLRESLKLTFAVILTFVLLLSVLAAILIAFGLARRLVAPIARLAAATRAVSDGRYDTHLPEGLDDELGFLVRSFNRMLRELELTTARARSSAEETERQRAFLETVLARLSSGVLVVDAEGHLRNANAAASTLLGDATARHVGLPLGELRRALPVAAPLVDVVLAKLREGAREFREEVVLPRADERQLLMLRGARLPDDGVVAVFDDSTAIDRARRDAAWAEVARRLAHEVKNPLTPIQLAAERLRRRVLPRLDADDADVLDRATHTIVAQVEALKTLVNAFGDYARAPLLQRQRLELSALVRDVIELYAGDPRWELTSVLGEPLPLLEADAGRLRQVLHNLIKNAQEANTERETVRIEIGAVAIHDNGRDWIDLWVADDGPGLPPGFDAGWFEPYRTTKPKGTGLGLAIVRKIAEEHGGTLVAQPNPGGGARFVLRLPL